MKVFALIVLAIASATCKGSGPYLPSGWRPEGPAFILPTEVKSSENPLQDEILAGSEASGSDFLREYGPPKVQEISQNLISQGLPDVVIEQIFNASPVKEEVTEITAVVEAIEENTEVKTEEPSTVPVEVITESVLVALLPNLPEAEVAVINSQTTTDIAVTEIETTPEGSAQNDKVTQQIIEIIEEINQPQESTTSSVDIVSESVDITEKSGQIQAVTSTDKTNEVFNLQRAQNIPEIIANLENENKNQQVEVSAVNDVPAIQVSGALEQAPEGFLEYGPPGFTEYGPPKGDSEDKSANLLSFETNETRRRRFSPKFRSSKKH